MGQDERAGGTSVWEAAAGAGGRQQRRGGRGAGEHWRRRRLGLARPGNEGGGSLSLSVPSVPVGHRNFSPEHPWARPRRGPMGHPWANRPASAHHSSQSSTWLTSVHFQKCLAMFASNFRELFFNNSDSLVVKWNVYTLVSLSFHLLDHIWRISIFDGASNLESISVNNSEFSQVWKWWFSRKCEATF